MAGILSDEPRPLGSTIFRRQLVLFFSNSARSGSFRSLSVATTNEPLISNRANHFTRPQRKRHFHKRTDEPIPGTVCPAAKNMPVSSTWILLPLPGFCGVGIIGDKAPPACRQPSFATDSAALVCASSLPWPPIQFFSQLCPRFFNRDVPFAERLDLHSSRPRSPRSGPMISPSFAEKDFVFQIGAQSVVVFCDSRGCRRVFWWHRLPDVAIAISANDLPPVMV